MLLFTLMFLMTSFVFVSLSPHHLMSPLTALLFNNCPPKRELL
ncbi:hypothetical protein LINPERHAP2_LOCUS17906 [Linum perenne]